MYLMFDRNFCISVALPPSLNFLSIIGDYSEDGILTASYGYVGGHEGKSIYNWYINEVCTQSLTSKFCQICFIYFIDFMVKFMNSCIK